MENNICPICYENYNNNIIKFNCKHNVCKNCYNMMIKYKKLCPLCRQQITIEKSCCYKFFDIIYYLLYRDFRI